MPELPIVAIVGAPNVGKSTLFNRLVRGRKALVTDEPGVTRDRIYGEVDSGSVSFRVVDTGGITPLEPTAPFAKGILAQAEAAMREAELVLFVVDARAGATATDRDVASLLRRRGANVVLVANKIDTPELEDLVFDLLDLGLGEAVPVSAEHGRGVDLLLDAIESRVGQRGGEAPEAEGAPAVKVAIIGRPNVGKSSILNRLLGEERVLVSEVPGTTRDAVDSMLERAGRRYVLVDTAGIRRKGKTRLTVETLSVVRARRAIEAADVVVLVLDGAEGIVAQDTHVAGYAVEAAKPVVVAVNKWDLVTEREQAAKAWEREVRARFRFVKEAPIVLLSARSGQRVSRILELVDAAYAAASRRVATPELNDWLRAESERERGAPAAGRSLKLFYATQTGVRPPRFVLFCTDARRVHFSLRRRLENSLRERFGFGAAPVRLTFRSRREAAR